ncbi:hypothetical protein Dsin_002612 [Dipteronia sinensis]|uniref:Glucosamine/galactosamine-6-phosphate isomerase domain-containing protein n=1 Tax=Dipteronia sinensis TaxID=43782 RepID=A0AAE0B6J0_9ROSI|nr:hypothetical protein Dsin_002612 [Dipteronia sinensis]
MERREAGLRLFSSSEELSSCPADYVYQVSESAVKERASFSLLLSGGDIPNRLEKLTRQPFLTTLEWSKWHVFWAKESVAPKRHLNSFHRQDTEAFISKFPFSFLTNCMGESCSYTVGARYFGEARSPANSYELSIRQQVRKRTIPISPSSNCLRFDLILLTLGTHYDVASLYTPNGLLGSLLTRQGRA